MGVKSERLRSVMDCSSLIVDPTDSSCGEDIIAVHHPSKYILVHVCAHQQEKVFFDNSSLHDSYIMYIKQEKC